MNLHLKGIGLVTKETLVFLLLGLAAVLSGLVLLSGYIIWTPAQVFYLVLGISSVRFVGTHRANERFGWCSLVLALLFLLFRAKILYLTSVLFFLLFLLEKGIGRMNHTPYLAVFLVWPAAKFALNAMSFPLRLQLTEGVAGVLTGLYPEVSAKGNIIALNGLEFIVGDACLGLSMFQAGLLMCLFLVGQYERTKRVIVTWWGVALSLAVTGVLIVAANWTRILLTVIFKSMPGTAGHEFLGLLCLLVYVFIPLLLGINFLGHYFVESHSKRVGEGKVMARVLAGTLALFFAFSGLFPESLQKREFDVEIASLQVPGYFQKVLKNDVLQFLNDTELVYVKPAVPFHASDHNPRICWRGSGYRFAGEYLEEVAGQKVVLSHLITPEGKTWYSCWWYDNGSQRTASQWEWRSQTLASGKPFRLINITSEDKAALEQAVRSWMKIMEDFQ